MSQALTKLEQVVFERYRSAVEREKKKASMALVRNIVWWFFSGKNPNRSRNIESWNSKTKRRPHYWNFWYSKTKLQGLKAKFS